MNFYAIANDYSARPRKRCWLDRRRTAENLFAIHRNRQSLPGLITIPLWNYVDHVLLKKLIPQLVVDKLQ